MGSNLTSKIYKLLDFVYFFFNLYKLLFSNLKKKTKNTTVITTTTKCYARVLGEAVQIQNS